MDGRSSSITTPRHPRRRRRTPTPFPPPAVPQPPPRRRVRLCRQNRENDADSRASSSVALHSKKKSWQPLHPRSSLRFATIFKCRSWETISQRHNRRRNPSPSSHSFVAKRKLWPVDEEGRPKTDKPDRHRRRMKHSQETTCTQRKDR